MIPKTESFQVPVRPASPRAILRRASIAIPALFLLVVIAACFSAQWLAPYAPNRQDLTQVTQSPSAEHWLGTDTLGRDVLSRLLWGGQESLTGVAQAVAVLLLVGVTLGLVAGYFGGLTDRIITRVIDIVQSLPFIIVVFAALSLFGRQMVVAMVVFGLLGSMGLARILRGATLAVRNELFVAAARVSGVGEIGVLARHIVPRILSVIVVQLSLFAAIALGVQTGLAFLGLGVVPPTSSWGSMVADGGQVIVTDGWLLLPSGGIIAACALALGLIGDGVRDLTSTSRSRSATDVPPALANWRSRRPDSAAAVGESGDVLRVENLVIEAFTSRHESTRLVNGVSFRINRGEVLGLVGESGSGKTMTALAILRLLPHNVRITSGSISLGGRDLAALGRREMDAVYGRRVALISQEPMASLDPAFTVGQQLGELIRVNTGCGRAAAMARSLDLLTRVQMRAPKEVLSKYPHELSGGMAQRVVIAMALSGDPELLIADEPTTALDVTVQAEILDLLREIQRVQGMSILLVTHDLGVVADICDDVAVMRRGEIVERSDTLSLFDQPQHPYTRSLIAATPSLSRELPEEGTDW